VPRTVRQQSSARDGGASRTTRWRSLGLTRGPRPLLDADIYAAVVVARETALSGRRTVGGHRAGFRERVDQHVEVDHPCVGLPARYELSGTRIVERVVEVEEATEVVACADVVAWEYVQSAQAAQQHISAVQRPTRADWSAGHCGLVVEVLKRVKVEGAVDDRLRGVNDRACLGHAEADCL